MRSMIHQIIKYRSVFRGSTTEHRSHALRSWWYGIDPELSRTKWTKCL